MPDADRQHRGAAPSSSSPRRSRRSSPTSTAAPRSSRSARSPTCRNFETCRLLWALDGARGACGGASRARRRRARRTIAQREQELDLESIVERFNQMLNRDLLVPAGARGRRRGRLHGRGARRASPASTRLLFYGVDLKQYGRADYDQMLANVADLPPDERQAADAGGPQRARRRRSSSGCAQRLGAQEIAVVSGIIKEAYRRLGVG